MTPSNGSRTDSRLKVCLVGAGWIGGIHLDALDRLGRTDLVGVASPRVERAAALASGHGGRPYDDVERMLDEERPDVAYVSVPPAYSAATCERLLERGIPFLVEKPLAAMDASGPQKIADRIAESGLVVAVGYHLRALEAMPEVRDRLVTTPPNLVVARWLEQTPPRAWWWKEDLGGGQVIEQATHVYDLARHLVGEATVVGAASTRSDPSVPEGADVADASAAVLRFDSGAVGTFANGRRIAGWLIDITFASDGLITTIGRLDEGPGDWTVSFADSSGTRVIPPGRSPYERQAVVFLDAVEAGDPDAVLATYRDALGTDRLTRAVVAATGERG
jgi:predicted dehydrogenase